MMNSFHNKFVFPQVFFDAGSGHSVFWNRTVPVVKAI